MVFLITPIVDRDLLPPQSPWTEMTFDVLNALILQGQVQASARKAELLQLQNIFGQIPTQISTMTGESFEPAVDETQLQPHDITLGTTLETTQIDYGFLDDAIWRTTFTADQLMNVADNLDLDGLEWMTTVSSSLPD